eukprot:6214173-Pleurochrysis_carterae.AAC.2
MFKHARSQHPCQMRSQTAMIRHSGSVSKTPAIAHARLELPLARAALLGDVLGVVGQPADVLAAGAHVAHELDHVVQVARAVVLDAAPGTGEEDHYGERGGGARRGVERG